jgi:hypothetical protein
VDRLVSVLRRPTGIFALVSAPTGDPTDPYQERLQPLAATPLEVCPWRDKDVKAWRALGRVEAITPRTALAIIRSLIGSVADPDLPAADPGALRLDGYGDLRPYLCSPDSEQLLIDQMDEALAAATADTGFPDWHWRRRRELAALPAAFRRSFLWGLHLSEWQTVDRTLALYRALELEAQGPLRRALARLLSLADRPTGLAWGDRIGALPAGARLGEVARILDSGAHASAPDPAAA